MSKSCIIARAKAFSSESARKYKFCVAGHFTLVHGMSVDAKRRIRKLALGR